MKFIKSTIINTEEKSLLEDNWISIFNSQDSSYKSKKLLLEVLIGMFYAFGLGYSLFYLDNLIKVGTMFVLFFIVLFIAIIIPHEFLHLLFFKSKDNIVIRYNYIKLMFVANSDGTISKSRSIIMLLTPFILFTVLPTVIINIVGFNVFLYALASVNAVKSGRDLLNIGLITKNVPNSCNLKLQNYDFYYNTDIEKI